ncbi:unnamed protein product [Ambrosiozyma monospora]|uniref:Unnamed protein product n=1 Tax=Ambrosiozyma monospora TaxID=43982 RepID=A0ACB5T1E4_AMBMO|nr:unnamed protein product [Ambrosiozyma monospora]
MYGYLGRVLAAFMGQVLVWCFPKSGHINSVYFCFVILQNLFGSFMSTVQFVSLCAFHTRIADPAIGGTYMTTLNTLSNMGGQWPKIIVMFLIDKFTTARCVPVDDHSPLEISNPFEDKEFYNCYPSDNKKLCLSNGGQCKIFQDGYYFTNMACIVIGLVLYFTWTRRTAKHLQSLPIGAWRVNREKSSLSV